MGCRYLSDFKRSRILKTWILLRLDESGRAGYGSQNRGTNEPTNVQASRLISFISHSYSPNFSTTSNRKNTKSCIYIPTSHFPIYIYPSRCHPSELSQKSISLKPHLPIGLRLHQSRRRFQLRHRWRSTIGTNLRFQSGNCVGSALRRAVDLEVCDIRVLRRGILARGAERVWCVGAGGDELACLYQHSLPGKYVYILGMRPGHISHDGTRGKGKEVPY